ncbi:hypothetical protein O6H91_04G097400 [Diphasiastrum complanatum]|uniref:Uncharacterized protein n=1 Tax=Diphasiastrum complanatum TaxID=34168 RepID=A0ACC2DZN4_DIPCM|nr:hypothetical protein O6H91_04G097400 [Diphasiastrum complanatum]
MADNFSSASSTHRLGAGTGSIARLPTSPAEGNGSVSRFGGRPMPQRSNSLTKSSGVDGDPLYTQLWHACAGSLVSLPRVGTRVVYFPQGHIEQVAACTNQGEDLQVPQFNLPSQILCRVLNMTLSAERETDEVFAQMTLVPECEQINPSEEVKEELPFCPKHNLHMFIKPLTASDTSTHGGFSVPRRAAEECLPPLQDFQQSPPTQDIIAKDLHGADWKFRHIYRGHPKRHLLTTGWSVFVSQKRLVAGDAVIFLRGENGELRLGVRRSVRQQSGVTSSSLLSSHCMHLGVLAAAAHAVSTKTMFSIFYNPRTSPAEFVIPYHKFVNALKASFSVGVRFKMRFETEETSERRYMGTITGVGDIDPVRWPNSNWRCLKVGWDEQVVCARQERVSPWEIELFTAPATPIPAEPRVTRLRLSTPVPSIDISSLTPSGSQVGLSPSLQFQALSATHDLRNSGVLLGGEEAEGTAKSANWGKKLEDYKSENPGQSRNIFSETWMTLARSDLNNGDRATTQISGLNQDYQITMRQPVQIHQLHQQQQLRLHLQQKKDQKDNSKLVDAPGYPYLVSPTSPKTEPVGDADIHLSVRPASINGEIQNTHHTRAHWSSKDFSAHSSYASNTDGRNKTWLSCLMASSATDTAARSALDSSTSHSKLVPMNLGSTADTSCPSLKSHQDQKGDPPAQSQADQSCKLFGFELTSGPLVKSSQVDQVGKSYTSSKHEVANSENAEQDNTTQPRFSKDQDWPQTSRTRIKVSHAPISSGNQCSFT